MRAAIYARVSTKDKGQEVENQLAQLRGHAFHYELEKHQTNAERRKRSTFYSRHGCLRCGTTERFHDGNGLCVNCYASTLAKLKRVLRDLPGGRQR